MEGQKSNWDRLRRIVACLIRAFRIPAHPQSQIEVYRNSKTSLKSSPTPLTVFDVIEAEKKIVQAAQAQSFPVETDKTVITVQLARLKPFEDEGILRVGGRSKHSELQYDAKNPVILPGEHKVTGLIVLRCHHLTGHAGTYQGLAEIKQRFWIVKGASSVRRVLHLQH